MQPDLSSTPLNWTDLSGTILPGGYELKELLEADGAAAQFRVRVLGDRDLDAVAQFIHVSPEEAERQISVWELMRELRHPNLTVPLGTGSWDRDGNELGYVVLRRADEALDGVLTERALTPAETKEVALSVVSGLEALHVNGLVHGCLSPEQVLSVADSIQLPITCIRTSGNEPEVPLVMPKYLAPESEDADGEAGENITAEADIWCLGTTIFESLTRKEWTEESREETAALPEPFATIALRCLEDDPQSRCKLPEALALLRGDIKPAPRAKAVAAAAGVPVQLGNGAAPPLPKEPNAGTQKPPQTADTASAPLAASAVPEARASAAAAPVLRPVAPPPPEPKPISTPKPQPKPPTPAPKVNVVRHQPAKPTSAPTRDRQPVVTPVPEAAVSRRWIWVGIAAILVLGIAWLLRPKSTAPVATVPAPRTATTPTAPQTARSSPPASTPQYPPSGETKVLQPDGTATAKTAPPPARTTSTTVTKAAPRAASIAATPATSTRGDIWHVILYTYGRSEDATRMAETINKRHPGLQAQVFSAKDNEGPYLVTAGGGMSREEATQARRKAVGNGMPRDSYIQNYNR